MKKTLRYLLFVATLFLIEGCPENEFDVNFVVLNQSMEKIFVVYDHQLSFQSSNFPEPTEMEKIAIGSNESYITQSEWFDDGRILFILICEQSVFENNDWETILEQELYNELLELDYGLLQEIDFTIEYSGF